MRLRRWFSRSFLHLFYRKLWAQITPVILLTVAIPVTLLGFLLISTSQKAIRRSTLSNYEQIAATAADEIALFVQRAQDVIKTAGVMLSAVYPAPWKQETLLVELVLEQPIVMRAVSVDLKGDVLASSELGRGMAWAYSQKALKDAFRGKGYISEVKMLDNRTPYVTMAVPIKKFGRAVGALIADVDFRGIWDAVDNIRLGETGRAFLVSQDGTLLAHHDKKMVLKKTSFSGQKDVRSVLAGRVGAVELKDASGKKIVSSYAAIPGLGWGIVLRQDQDEAYRFSGIMKTQSWLIFLVSEILALLVSVFIARFLTRPIKTLVSRIKNVAEGDLDDRIAVKKRDEIGELIRSFNDMTGKLKQARERARLSAIGEAAAWISHELKNSLMLLKSFVHSFPEEHADPDFADRFGRLVPAEISRWERMLNELSGLSSRDELKIARVNINDLLADTLEMMARKLSEKKIHVRYLRQNEPLHIMADRQRLSQVFVNLIVNAVNAMPEGGTLTVSANAAPGKEILRASALEIKVEDTGRGMSEGALGNIFDPFSVDLQGKRGLGLVITRKIVEQHGGRIKAESRSGAGTTFIITLPQP